MSKGPRNVAELDRCCQCGMCESICNNVVMARTDGKANQDFIPLVKKAPACDHCHHQNCLGCCPVVGDQAELESWLGPNDKTEIDFGPIKKMVIAYAKDQHIAQRSASGGVVSSIIKFLLDNNTIAGAIVVTKDGADPLGGQFVIVRNRAELLTSCSSIYAPVPLGRVITQILRDRSGAKFVFVGRPCQVRALAKTALLKPRLKDKIYLTISIFCAWQISVEGVKFLSTLSGVKTGEPIRAVEYRRGTWPGNLTFLTQAARKELPLYEKGHTYGTYYYPLVAPFVPEVCRQCFDVVGNLADLAVGDPWNLGLQPKDGHGYSLVIARNEVGLQVIDHERFKQDYVEITHPVSVAQLDQSQGQTIRLKQAGALADRFAGQSGAGRLRRYYRLNRLFSGLIKHVSLKFIPHVCFRLGLKVVWWMMKKRVDPAKYVES